MFEQKSDKKLMTTVVLGWRRAAERGRMERRQGDEMAAAAAAAAAVEEQQMAVKERMAKAKYAAHSGAILRNSARNFLTRLLPLQVRVEHARRAHHRLYRVEGRVGGARQFGAIRRNSAQFADAARASLYRRRHSRGSRRRLRTSSGGCGTSMSRSGTRLTSRRSR